MSESATLFRKATCSCGGGCPACQKKSSLNLSQPNDPAEIEADQIADKVMRMPAGETAGHESTAKPTASQLNSPSKIHRKCDACEEEDEAAALPLRRKEAFASAAPTPPPAGTPLSIRNALSSGGQPLDQQTRNFFEPRLDRDLSSVRIHTGSLAENSARAINAKAYTLGSNIVFGNGEYKPESESGKHLIAHELAHTIQQNLFYSSPYIQRDEADSEPDEPAKRPQDLLHDRLADYESDPDDPDITSQQKAKNLRISLLLEAEIDRLDDEPGYEAEVIEEDPELELYEGDTINEVNGIAESESDTIDKLIKDRKLAATREEFAWDPFFAGKVAAFPESFSMLAVELLAPPFLEGVQLIEDYAESNTYLESRHKYLSDGLFDEGFPVGRDLSLILTEYELIRSKGLRYNVFHLLKRMPKFEPDLNFALNLEKKDPLSGYLFFYQSAWIKHAINLYGATLFTAWNSSYQQITNSFENGQIESVDPVALKEFQKNYPRGLERLDEMVQFDAPAINFADSAFNPYNFYGILKGTSVLSAANNTADFIAQEHSAFAAYLSTADIRVFRLEESDRLEKALDWSVTKGFAAAGIRAVVDNFGNLLMDILEDKVEKSIFKRIVSFVVSLHPLGRLAALAYNIYQAVDDIKDTMDILSLVNFTISTIDSAKSATSVIAVQRSAAQLSKVYEEVIPLIAQKISAGLAKKLMRGSDKTKGSDDKAPPDNKPVTKPATPHERKKLLDETKDIKTVDKLIGEPKYLLAELDTAGNSSVKKSSHPDYEVEITLPNNHTWRRNAKGIWCRVTEPSCLLSATDLPDEMRQQLEDMDADAAKFIQAEGTQLPPGQRLRPQLGHPESLEAARAAGVSDEVLHSGTVFTRVDFPDIVPDNPLPEGKPAPKLPAQAEELRRGVAGRRPTTDPDWSDVQNTEVLADIMLVREDIVKSGGTITEVAINRTQRTGPGAHATKASQRTRPDVQIALVDGELDGRRLLIEYDRAPGTRAMKHAREILMRDPDAIVIIKIIGFDKSK